MTSELRPAVEVALAVYDECREKGIRNGGALIKADREAVRAKAYRSGFNDGQAGLNAAVEIASTEAAAELAKFKALAETLARALARCGRIVERHNWRQSEKVDDVKRIVAETLRQYKEARDAS